MDNGGGVYPRHVIDISNINEDNVRATLLAKGSYVVRVVEVNRNTATVAYMRQNTQSIHHRYPIGWGSRLRHFPSPEHAEFESFFVFVSVRFYFWRSVGT